MQTAGYFPYGQVTGRCIKSFSPLTNRMEEKVTE